MHIMTENKELTIYFGNSKGAPFIGFFPRLHYGWQSSRRIRHGLNYYQPAILVGRLYTDSSRWIPLGRYVWPNYLTRSYHKYKNEDDGKVQRVESA